jgi:SAM-dependent methyltransferase
VDLVTKYMDSGAHILEIGCNMGRNLIHLYQAGYRELAAVEISEAAIRLFRDSYPEVARHSDVHNAPVESVIEGFPDNAFDLVFTMAVIEHIHTESEWIFPEVARITGDLLITIEDESGVSERHFPRNYREVFEPLGLRQIERLGCGEDEGFKARMVARIFRREN